MRVYEREKPNGIPAKFGNIKARRGLIGKKISWNERGWLSTFTGVVSAVEGRNVLVNGDWKWATSMLNVHVVD